MNRHNIIEAIGKQFLTSNIESNEFSYPQALKAEGKFIDPSLVATGNTTHQYLDMRFVDGGISVLIETKDNFDKYKREDIYSQISAYVNYEKVLTGNKIIAILANTQDDRIKVWWGSDLVIDESHQLKNQYSLKSFGEYAGLYSNVVNDKEQVIKYTYALNEILHKHGVSEKIRSQLVGTCLLALKYDVKFEGLSTKQIIGGIEEVISNLLDKDLNKASKLSILKTKVLESQDVSQLKPQAIQEILRHIEKNITPFVNDKNAIGQDILNLFFTTFNKYVGKTDKNQAFTPDHIVHFMCRVVGVNRNSRVLDPCCGSGAFLVRAMTEAIDDCANEEEIDGIKKKNIYGIEYEETAFGLSTTNMLIHGDGNSNVRQGSCFELSEFIEDARINVVLMNPPYNAQRRHCLKAYTEQWPKKIKEDPSQGFHFVHHVASLVKTGKLAVLLPMQCAIGASKEILKFKQLMLNEHTLDAVFSFPEDIFHPGATASACCMIFNLGERHDKSCRDTFFGYFKNDGFVKKKNLGRIEKTKLNKSEGVWADIESNWLDLYQNREARSGISVNKKVTATDEWLAEVYMDTDYSLLSDSLWIKTLRKHVAYQLLNGNTDSASNNKAINNIIDIKKCMWASYQANEVFDVKSGIQASDVNVSDVDVDGGIVYLRPSNSYSISNGFIQEEDAPNKYIFSDQLVMGNTGAGSHTWTYYILGRFIPNNNLSVLLTKDKLNKFQKIFLIPILESNRYRYAYGRIPSQTRFLSSTIYLPSKNIIEADGTKKTVPDWQFMEDYIKSLPYSASL
jgi:type I restriction-modification system DNA methylase subunit